MPNPKAIFIPPNSVKYTLPSGDAISSVALGTAGKGESYAPTLAALKAGYRHIDSAWAYRGEAEVGQAIKDSGVPRSELWITSKLWNSFHNPKDIEPVLDESLKNLQTTYLDLYLIHWPVARDPVTKKVDPELTENEYVTWKKLEELVDKGKIRNIGVSNFNMRRLQDLASNPLKYYPTINQVELNYFNPQPELLEWSKANNILLEAYSPLGSDVQVKEALSVPEVVEISKELGISGAQVLLSWMHQRGVVVLPKTRNVNRVKENFELYRLPQAAFDKLEKAAISHPPQRVIDPSKALKIDIFEDAAEKIRFEEWKQNRRQDGMKSKL
ncbi:Aldo/keto reductase [Clavulina sp. PMI_390]|nr:Aldo/keto reductase [Clavulina sp. PMI_390]